MAIFVHTILDDGTIIDGAVLGVGPGDVIEIEGNSTEYTNIRFENVNGSVISPVIIRNAPDRSGPTPDYTEPVRTSSDNDIQFLDNCSHIIMTGDGIPTIPFGFQFKRRVRCVTDFSDVAFYRIFSDTTGNNSVNFFIQIRQSDGDPNHIIENLHIADCLLKAPTNENFYIGPNNANAADGLWQNRNTIIERNTCYDSAEGIQVSSSLSGLVIRFNTLLNIAPADDTAFNAAITLPRGGASGVSAQVYGNLIIDCDGHGFNINDTFSEPGNLVNFYNNILVRCGTHPTSGKNRCVFVQAGDGDFHFFNNTIIDTGNGTDGDAFRFTDAGSTNRTENNIIIGSDGDDISLGNGATTTDVNNIKQADSTGLNFVSEMDDDYRLAVGSSAINAAISGLTAVSDHDEFLRNGTPDVGAFEFLDPRPSDLPLDCGEGSVEYLGGNPPTFRGRYAGWTSAAKLIGESKGGDWEATYRVGSHDPNDNVSVCFGVSAADTDEDWSTIEFGVWVWHLSGEFSRMAVIESGSLLLLTSDAMASGVGGETYTLRKNGTDVELYVGIGPDEILVHTYTDVAPASVVLDMSSFWSEIYDGPITLDNITLSGS